MASSHINSLAELRERYGTPTRSSVKKQANELNDTYRQWLGYAGFFVLASAGEDGVDCTPRGDKAGEAFTIVDNKTLLIPDRRGNNRLDTLSNIISNPHVALLFFIPGIDQTLRVVGRAVISVDPTVLNQFVLNNQAPLSCIVVTIDAVYFQNSRALARSGLWTSEHLDHTEVPSPEQMLDSIEPLNNP